MTSPLILVNLKTYKEGMGNRAHMITQAAQMVSHETGVTIGIAPNYIDLHPLCQEPCRIAAMVVAIRFFHCWAAPLLGLKPECSPRCS